MQSEGPNKLERQYEIDSMSLQGVIIQFDSVLTYKTYSFVSTTIFFNSFN